MDRRRKFWGWGFEDQQPPEAEVAAAAAGAREHLGFAPAEVERPARLEDIELRPPRIEPPGSLAHICATDRYERVTHSYGKAYRDIVRALPGPVRQPARRGRAARRRGRRRAGARVVRGGRRGGDPVRRRHERGRRRRAAAGPPGGVDRPAARSTGCSRWTRSRAPRGSRPACSGRRSRTSCASTAYTLRHFPQSFEYSTLGGWIATRAGGHFATLYTHIDDLVESVRAVTPRGLWESRRLPGSGAGPSPDRMLIGSEGILGVITEAWMRVQAAPTLPGVGRRDLRLVRIRRRSRARPVTVRPPPVELPPARRRRGRPDRGAAAGGRRAARPARPRLRIRRPRAGALDEPRPGALRGPRRPAARRRPDVRPARGRSAEGAWRNAFLQAPYLRDTLVAAGIFAETFETAITWDRLPGFRRDREGTRARGTGR